MKENNNKEYATQFTNNIKSILNDAKYIGTWDWGNPAGNSGGIDTYEVTSKNGIKFWCSIVEYLNAGTYQPNRMALLVSYPADKRQSLNSTLSVVIPYEFSRRFNTRAYRDNDNYEIRNYGNITIGRAGIKREDFFEYFEDKYPEKVFIDEEAKKYIKIYEYTDEMALEQFAEQTCEALELIDTFKKQYR